MKFLLDADMPRSSAKVIAARGHDVLDVRDAGLKDLSDDGVILFAKKTNRIVMTRDLGFGDVLARPKGFHVGVVIIRVPYFFRSEQINRAIDEFMNSVKEEEFKDAVIIVELGRYRVRRL